jgi:hypothetical protein
MKIWLYGLMLLPSLNRENLQKKQGLSKKQNKNPLIIKRGMKLILVLKLMLSLSFP